MKVLHILDHSRPIISGYSSRSHYILKWQKQDGIDVLAMSSPIYNRNNDENLIDDIKYYRCNNFFSHLFLRKIFSIYSMKRKIEDLFIKERFDLIHAHSPSILGIATILAGRTINVPFVYEVRALWEDAAVDQGKIKQGSLLYNLYKKIEGYVFNKADSLVVICDGLRKDLISRGCDDAKVFVVPNGIDIQRFNANKENSSSLLKRKLGIKDELVIGFIGSFYRFEGLDLLVEAVAKIEGIKVVLVGDGEMYQDIKVLVEQIGVSSKVVLTGKVPHEEVQDYYSLMDILVYPRKKQRITEMVTPLKPLEAMALGKVVVGSDVGGIKEIIGEDMNAGGLIFKADDRRELLNTLVMVINDSNLRRQLKKKALNRAKQRDWKSIIKIYREVYDFAQKNFQGRCMCQS